MSGRLTAEEARAVLGLATDAAPLEVTGAFRAAAKAAHPDRPGGDAARFRQILEAYRLLQSPRLPVVIEPAAPLPQADLHIEIGPMIALFGGEAEAATDAWRVNVRIPPGARHGERIRVGDASFRLRISPEPSMQVRGSDLWVTARLPAAMLARGGRASVATPIGEKVLWVSRKVAERGLVRLEGQGLPARGRHPQGSLFIRLVSEAGAAESAARAQLRRFAAAWAA